MIALKRAMGKRREHSDDQAFVARYEKGRPWEGYTDWEVLGCYRQIAACLTPAEFEWAAQEAVARFSPLDRQLLGGYLQRQAQQQGVHIAELEGNAAEDRFRDARVLGRVITHINYRRKDGLEQLLGTRDDVFDSLLAKGALAGIVAAVSKRSA
jgi:hypothetical protein